MSKPIHTPGPVDLLWEVEGHDPDNIILRSTHNGLNMGICEVFESEANAKLLRAAYNAFDSAARKLGCNAIQLAEAMQEGALLAEVLDNADAILYHTPHLDKEAFGKVEAVLAK